MGADGSSLPVLTSGPAKAVPQDAKPRSPSCINLLDVDPHTPVGYKNLGLITAAVSPTTLHPHRPAEMFLEQAQRLERRLQTWVKNLPCL